MGKKVGTGYRVAPTTRTDLTRLKKGRPDYPFCSKFFRRPEVRTDKKLSGPSPNSEFRTIGRVIHLIGIGHSELILYF